MESGARGHVGGQDVVGMAVEVLAGPVIPHRGARISVAGGYLNVAQVHARIEHRGDERVSEHVRVRPGDRYAPGLSEPIGGPGRVLEEADCPRPGPGKYQTRRAAGRFPWA